MSYRDLRNLCEILRAVGYPRLVSIENFRNPNFALVADISRWLVLQYEPKADIPSSCDSESERVALVRTFAEFMLINVQVKLNTKRLYQADGYAVKELLKVASVLYNAVREAESSQSGNRSTSTRTLESDYVKIDTKELKETRSLASHLVQKGVSLYDMLSKEVSLRDARQQALSKAYEHAEVEHLIRSAIESGAQEAKKMTTILETVQNNLSNLEGKADKKKMELERSQKRLLTLKKVRPAFMDEYEELQQDMEVVYQEYVNRFRCLAYIQNQIEDMDRLEEERKTEERLSKAEVSRRSGGDDLLSYGNGKGAFMNSSGSEESSDEMSIGLNKTVPPSTTGNSSRSGGGISGIGLGLGVGANKLIGDGANGDSSRKSGHRRTYGSMLGAEEDSEDESDMILVDGDNDNSELGSEDDEDELLAIQKENLGGGGSKIGRNGAHISRMDNKKHQLNGITSHSDEILIPNGGGIPHPTANGGKGYPVDNNNSVTRTRSTVARPTTQGRNRVPVSEDF